MSDLLKLIAAYGASRFEEGMHCDEQGCPISYSEDAAHLAPKAAAKQAHEKLSMRITDLEEKAQALDWLLENHFRGSSLHMDGTQHYMAIGNIGRASTPLAAVLDAIAKGKND